MRVFPIKQPLPGEQVVGIDPPLAPETDASWRRRINLLPGRALDDDALTAEQDLRAGRMATQGQALSPGVIAGLEVRVEIDPEEGHFLRISSGMGLMASGEDVVVPTELRLALRDLQVFGPLNQIDEEEPPAEEEEEEDIVPRSSLLNRTLLGRFEDWIDDEDNLPRAAILLLQPIEASTFARRQGADDPTTDPCEEDPSAYAFENWERRDGCRVLIYPWPTDWLPLPANGDNATWRNQIAYTVFRQEMRRGPDEDLPWEALGVPIGLIGFDDEWNPLFVDRSSVVRAGGKPKRRTDLVPGAGTPYVWQARFDQLLEELADADSQNVPIEDIVARFRYVPPSGLLPRSAFAPEMAQQWFFPSSYVIDAAPVPIEHLDVALEASASLARYDLFTPDQVRLLVPVPRKVFEPRLLHGEEVDPIFRTSVDTALERRAEWLGRRENVRRKSEVLLAGLTGLAPTYPAPTEDPGRLDASEDPPAFPAPISGRAHQSGSGPGLHLHRFTGAKALPIKAETARLVTWVFLDPINPPQELMLSWSGTRNVESGPANALTTQPEAVTVNAYWGGNLIAKQDSPPINAGPLPSPGRWVRLEVSAKDLTLFATTALNGRVVDVAFTALAFAAQDGRATWARSGLSALETPSPAQELVWVGEDLPEGATPNPPSATEEAWNWLPASAAQEENEDSYRTRMDGTPPIRVPEAMERLVEELKDTLISWDELGEIHSLGLENFVELLDAKVDQANDAINFGYLRVQTAQYRLRQLVLGDKVTDKLVVSPILSMIAKESQGAAQLNKNLTEVFKQMQSTEADKKPKRWWGREIEIPFADGGGPDFFTRNAAFLKAAQPKAAEPAAVTNLAALSAVANISAFEILQPATFTPLNPDIFAFDPGLKGGSQAAVPETPSAPPTKDVEGARHTTDKSIRTTSIAQRLFDSTAVEAKDFSAATKRDIIKSVLGLSMYVDDLPISGMPLTEFSPEFANIPPGDIGVEELPDNGTPPKYRRKDVPGLGDELMLGTGMPARETKPREILEFRGPNGEGFNPELLNLIASEADPLDPSDTESNYFAIGSDLLNHAVAVLRATEGRVQEYKSVIERCGQAIEEMTQAALDTDRRLKVIEDELTEARHDVATARSLLVEEEARVLEINQRRESIIREHVRFIAYHRPRLTDPLIDAPVRPLDPGPTPSPVPECLSHEIPTPPELRQYLDLLREAPTSWFVHIPKLLDRFDQPDILFGMLNLSKARSQVATAVSKMETAPLARNFLAQSLGSVRLAQEAVVTTFQQQRQVVDLTPLRKESWQTVRTLAPAIVGLADLIDPRHGRIDVARMAAQELDNIAHVAACLYRHFGEVLPAIRLVWAEGLSQYDATVSLRNLAVLARWGEIDILDRREMQSLVDWIFLRVNAQQPEAVSLINDLVRTALLVASHSPVNEIISGHLQDDAPVQPGRRVPIVTLSPAVRIGMEVMLYKGPDIVARGVVEDLSAGIAATRILSASRNETLAKGARAHFAPSHSR